MLASTVIREARRVGIGAETLIPVGSLRRFSPEVGQVALLATAPASEHRHLLSAFRRLPVVSAVRAETTGSVTATTDRGDITLYVSAPADAGAALVWHTGSRSHVAQLQQRASSLGLRFLEGRVTQANGTPLRCSSEPELYAMLRLPYIAPELRSGDGELSAAERGELPHLVSELDIRGDLHMHSTWSDGRNTIADMVTASKQLGYEYIAITDHSERAQSSRRIAAADVPAQRAEIERLRTRVRSIEILHGIEVDIMKDGSLDFDDTLLAGFDIVLASLHDPGDDDAETLTKRYMNAIRHPLVNVITHPANRAPANFQGYPIDFNPLFEAAAEAGTAMEIDGAPGHLDLDGAMARRAVAAGVTLVVDSDAHRMDALGRQMRFGIGTARRGWIESQHVLNAGAVDGVRAFVNRKRSRG